MPTPLSLDTAEYIRKRMSTETENLSFLAALEEIHKISPHFIEDVLQFLEICENIKAPSFISASRGGQNGPVRPR